MAKLKKLKVQETVKDPGEFSPDDPRGKMLGKHFESGGPTQNAPEELTQNPYYAQDPKHNGKLLDPSTWQTPAQLEFEKRLAKK